MLNWTAEDFKWPLPDDIYIETSVLMIANHEVSGRVLPPEGNPAILRSQKIYSKALEEAGIYPGCEMAGPSYLSSNNLPWFHS